MKSPLQEEQVAHPPSQRGQRAVGRTQREGTDVEEVYNTHPPRHKHSSVSSKQSEGGSPLDGCAVPPGARRTAPAGACHRRPVIRLPSSLNRSYLEMGAYEGEDKALEVLHQVVEHAQALGVAAALHLQVEGVRWGGVGWGVGV